MSRVVRRAGDRPDPSRAHPCFAGCGYLGMYQLGAAACFRLNAPYLFGRKAAGASVGALVAAANLCRVPLGKRPPPDGGRGEDSAPFLGHPVAFPCRRLRPRTGACGRPGPENSPGTHQPRIQDPGHHPSGDGRGAAARRPPAVRRTTLRLGHPSVGRTQRSSVSLPHPRRIASDFPTAWGGPERPKRPSSSFPPDCSYPAPTPRPRGSDMPETVRKVIEEESSETGLPIFSPSFLWRGPGKMLRLLRSASVRLTCRLLDGSRKLCLAAGCRLIDGAEKLLLLLTRALEKLEPDAGGYGLYCRWAVQEFHPGLCQSKAEGGNPLPAEKRPVGRLRLLMDSDPLPAPTADREELDRAARALADRALRAARTALDGLEGGGRPTELEEVLKMTEEKEALMSFYYLDEKRRVNRTSIFSMEDEKGALS
ncbi:uncharacterized protein LOC111638480 isoform X2 [Centruroides sculpturatus]|uniref:uncharacterized protein LOC111638480 isoform X2 n=1 Tax=Centruroides sculpturatus TaxID=218467 RepID=UPI000C6E454C|nr:uncharacterized protein LOC111638480 isoform X2 [Centruroides sculpturatus]